MSATAVITTAATVAGAIGNAAAKTNQAIGTMSELMDHIRDLKDRGVVSLSQYAKRTLLTSRVYVEDQLASEDITPKLLKVLNSIYTGLIMCSMGLNYLCKDGRTIRSMTNAIATESNNNFLDMLKGFGDAEPSTEANAPKKVDGEGSGDNNQNIPLPKEKELKSDSEKLFVGRLLEMLIPGGPDGKAIPLYFYVQLLPIVTPSPVMYKFLEAHTSPTLAMRWAMWKAGEIKFWKDFVFEADRVAKRKKALQVDKDGILREIEDHRAKMLKQKMANYKVKDAQARARNLCNSIVVCTKRTIDSVCKDIGVNLKSFSQRQSMMEDMFALALAVVDTNYGTVDLYLNGIEARGEYTAKMIDSTSKNGGELNMKEVLALISAGSMPRF